MGERSAPIVYTVVAQSGQIRCEHSAVRAHGHEAPVKLVLSRLPQVAAKKAYKKDPYFYNFVSTASGTVFLCVTEGTFSQKLTFAYLDELQQRWGDGSQAASFARVIAERCTFYSGPQADKVKAVRDRVDEVKGIMLENIDAVLRRGEQLEVLEQKTDDLKESSKKFQRGATQLKRMMCLKNVKMWIIIAIVLALVVFFIVVAACGGFTFPNCH